MVEATIGGMAHFLLSIGAKQPLRIVQPAIVSQQELKMPLPHQVEFFKFTGSVDRLDNSTGHVEANQSIVHLACNLGRNKRTVDDFKIYWSINVSCCAKSSKEP